MAHQLCWAFYYLSLIITSWRWRYYYPILQMKNLKPLINAVRLWLEPKQWTPGPTIQTAKHTVCPAPHTYILCSQAIWGMSPHPPSSSLLMLSQISFKHQLKLLLFCEAFPGYFYSLSSQNIEFMSRTLKFELWYLFSCCHFGLSSGQVPRSSSKEKACLCFWLYLYLPGQWFANFSTERYQQTVHRIRNVNDTKIYRKMLDLIITRDMQSLTELLFITSQICKNPKMEWHILMSRL